VKYASTRATAASRSARSEGSEIATWQASTAQTNAGYAAGSDMTKAALTVHGTVTLSSATTSAQGDETTRLPSRYTGIAVLAKRTALTAWAAVNASTASRTA